MENQLKDFQRELEPLAIKIGNIQRSIDSLNQTLIREWKDLEDTQHLLKMEFLKGSMALKNEYKTNIPNGNSIDSGYVIFRNFIIKTVSDLKIQITQEQLEGILGL